MPDAGSQGSENQPHHQHHGGKDKYVPYGFPIIHSSFLLFVTVRQNAYLKTAEKLDLSLMKDQAYRYSRVYPNVALSRVCKDDGARSEGSPSPIIQVAVTERDLEIFQKVAQLPMPSFADQPSNGCHIALSLRPLVVTTYPFPSPLGYKGSPFFTR